MIHDVFSYQSLCHCAMEQWNNETTPDLKVDESSHPTGSPSPFPIG